MTIVTRRRAASRDPSPSPPTARVIDVLELVAGAEPAARLADVVRELGISHGTAQAIVSTLCERGWLSRNPADRSLTLGPGLGPLTARASTEPLRARAGRLAAETAAALGCAVSVTERSGDTLLITALEGHRGDVDVAAGDRVPYAAPLGLAFAAWEPVEQRRAWMGPGAGGNGEQVGRLEGLLEEVRQRGYSVERMTRTLAQTLGLISALRHEASSPLQHAIDDLRAEITAASLLAGDGRKGPSIVTSIAAPVFGADGRVACNVSAHPFRALTARQVASIGRRLARGTQGTGGSPQQQEGKR